METWFKFERSVLSSDIINHDTEYLAVWVYLLSHAAYKTQKVLFDGKPTELKPGQLITSRKRISEDMHINEGKVERVLKKFIFAQLIKQQTCFSSRLITVLGEAADEKSEQQIIQQSYINHTATIQQANTYKKEKKDKKERRYNNAWLCEADFSAPSYDLEAFKKKALNLKYEKKQ